MIRSGIQALKLGYWPSLVGAWLHFEVSFMIWVLMGALGIAISQEFGLSATQKGFLVATPLLGGSVLRIFIGPLADHHGPKVIGLLILLLEVIALAFAWLWSTNYLMLLGVGLLFGFAGASFAIALPIASQAYPPAHQGLAMGVAAVGNSGVLLATFLAPRLAEGFGWRNTFGFMMLPVILTAVVFWVTVLPGSQSAGMRRSSSPWQLLREALSRKFMYWLCFLYGVTFGGFVGLSSFLPIFFHDQYDVSMVMAGTMTAFCGLAGSLARPFGGHLADRKGGLQLLQGVFPVVTILCIGLGQLLPPSWAFPLSVSVLLLLGFGNGVVFQVASLRFRNNMGTASGLIGAAGALGGFLLPAWFGILKDLTGTFASGFWVLACIAGFASVSILVIQRSREFSVPQSG
ncbi:MAG: MFS transporter [Nitrospirales bacterium]|nr:NarK/NasA family nitrate transporter [Nitrospira sp.]MDR4502791.1 MFS transporter [Nitrospirales bacterium]